jgi:1,4-dihydroxy-2-naphthoate octaprenyltransferase
MHCYSWFGGVAAATPPNQPQCCIVLLIILITITLAKLLQNYFNNYNFSKTFTKLDKEKNQCIREKTGAQNIVKEIKQYQKKWL